MKTLPDPPHGKYVEVPITIRYGDTDPDGVVYFASYFRYCHYGMEEFFRQIGFTPKEAFRNFEEGFGLPVAGAACDFFKPVWYGETLRLAVFIIQAKTRSLTFGFHFYREETDELVAKGHVTMVTIN